MYNIQHQQNVDQKMMFRKKQQCSMHKCKLSYLKIYSELLACDAVINVWVGKWIKTHKNTTEQI